MPLAIQQVDVFHTESDIPFYKTPLPALQNPNNEIRGQLMKLMGMRGVNTVAAFDLWPGGSAALRRVQCGGLVRYILTAHHTQW